jgi:WD40 repeat protein
MRRAAYCSTLAMYVYDIASTPRLDKILCGSDRTILSVAWSRHDPNTIAMAVSEAEHNILLWDLENELLTKRMSPLGPPAKFLQWCVRHLGINAHPPPEPAPPPACPPSCHSTPLVAEIVLALEGTS